MKTLAERLQYARLKKGLTQEQLAEISGTTQQNIQNIEAGIVSHPRKIRAIARGVDQSPAWLQFGSEAIEKLDADAIVLAQNWMDLEEPQKTAIKNAILEMAKSLPRRKR